MRVADRDRGPTRGRDHAAAACVGVQRQSPTCKDKSDVTYRKTRPDSLKPLQPPVAPPGDPAVKEAAVQQLKWLKQVVAREPSPAMTEDTSHCELRELRAMTLELWESVSCLRQEVAQQGKFIAAKLPAHDDEQDDTFEPPQSLANFCIVQAMAPFGPTFDGVLATVQLVMVTSFQYSTSERLQRPACCAPPVAEMLT